MKQLKRAVIGFLLGAMLFGGIGAYAASESKMIEVFYIVKDIKINNVSQMPEQAPFVYEGTTYVPLRYISEKLGEQVKWDGSTGTIYIGDTGEENAVYLEDGIKNMRFSATDDDSRLGSSNGNKIKDNINNEYDQYVTLYIDAVNFYGFPYETSTATVEYPLNGQFKTFKATAGLTENYKDTISKVELTIKGDDEIIYEGVIEAGEMPLEIDLDVSGVVKLSISAKNINGQKSHIGARNGNVQIGLFNAKVIK